MAYVVNSGSVHLEALSLVSQVLLKASALEPRFMGCGLGLRFNPTDELKRKSDGMRREGVATRAATVSQSDKKLMGKARRRARAEVELQIEQSGSSSYRPVRNAFIVHILTILLLSEIEGDSLNAIYLIHL